MVLFARTNLRIARVFLILGTITFAVISTPTHAEQPAHVHERESLRGLVGMEVVVEPLNIRIEDQGLHTVMLHSSITQRLQKAGIKVLTERERLATPTAAVLTARVDALHDRIGRYFYSNDLMLTQRIRLAGTDATELSAVTWMKLGGIGIVADDNVKHIEDQVLRKVDQFIKDYLTVNPDRRANSQ